MSYITKYIEFTFDVISFKDISYAYKNNLKLLSNKDNIKVLSIIYNEFFEVFILAGVILFVAIINAVILTLNSEMNLKKQIYYIQNSKTVYNSLRFRKKKSKVVYKKFK